MIIEEDDCCTYGIEYSLGRRDSSYNESSEPKVSVTRFECRYPTYVCNKIKNQLLEHQSYNNELIQAVISVTNDCAQNLGYTWLTVSVVRCWRHEIISMP